MLDLCREQFITDRIIQYIQTLLYFYLPTSSLGKIQRRRRAAEDYKEIVQTTGKLNSFAVDWMGGNVFWIESNLTEYTIKVKSIFGTGDRVLSKIQSYSQPAHLVLHPEKR